MIYRIIRSITAISLSMFLANASFSQDSAYKNKPVASEQPAKPFKILTSGKKITVQSSSKLSSVLVWSSGGNRFVEQTNIEASSFSFNVPAKEKFVFLMVEINGRRYTQKVGLYDPN